MRHTLARGLLATLAASLATTLGAALARAAGVDFQLPGAPEPIPIAGFGVMTAVWSVVGIALALTLQRWSARPAHRWVQAAVALTALSLVPPVLTGAGAATILTLEILHVVAAAIVIPMVAGSLRAHAGRTTMAAASG